jgi:hypothetical protein
VSRKSPSVRFIRFLLLVVCDVTSSSLSRLPYDYGFHVFSVRQCAHRRSWLPIVSESIVCRWVIETVVFGNGARFPICRQATIGGRIGPANYRVQLLGGSFGQIFFFIIVIN